MKKDAYYFPHFSNARNDSKLIKIRRVMGIEGYGLYFMLLEVLRDQTDFKMHINTIEDLAFEWHISKGKIFAVINNFDLFTISDDNFFSPKLIFYLQPYLEKSERARVAALVRWKKINANADANALPEHSDSNASKVKESKVKESKVKEINIDFDIFWNLYDKKVGDKNKLQKKWINLKNIDRQNIINYIPKYKLSVPDKKFRKNPETFFNNKSWNDEIIINNKSKHLQHDTDF